MQFHVFFADARIEYPLNSMSSIAPSMSSFVHPLMALIFLVELAPCIVVEGGSMVDGWTVGFATTWAFSTSLHGTLETMTSLIISSFDEVHHNWAPLVPRLLLFLIRFAIETHGMAATTCILLKFIYVSGSYFNNRNLVLFEN